MVKLLKKDDYEIDEKDRNILLTNQGINNVEKSFFFKTFKFNVNNRINTFLKMFDWPDQL